MSDASSTDDARTPDDGPRRWRAALPRPFAVVVLIALCLIPLLYASTLIWANDDPTGHLDQVPAAIVNEDAGSTVTSADGSTTEVRLGDDVVDALVDEDGESIEGFGWTVTDAGTAAAGLADGTYLAVLTIPEDFSAAATSSATVDPADAADATQGVLRIATDDATSYLTGNIAQTLGKTIAANLAESVSATYLENVYLGFTSVHDSISTAADGASTLADGAGTLADGAADLDDGLQAMVTATSALPSGATTLSTGVSSALTGAQSLSTGLDQLAAGASTLADGTGTALTGAQTLADGLDQLAGSTPTLSAGATTVADGLDQLLAGYDTLTDAQRKALLTQLAAGADQVEQGTVSVDSAAASLAAGAEQLVGSADASTGLTALAAGATEVSTGAASAASGASSLVDGLGDLSDGASTLSTSLTTLTGSIATAADGSATLAAGAQDLRDGANTLADGLADGVDSIPTYTDEQATSLSEAAALPVALDSVRENEVANNGTGLTPYFLALGLWIGTLAVFFMRPALHERLLRRRTPAILVALRSYLPNAIIAIAQSVLAVTAVHLAVGIDIADLPAAYALAALASLTFMAINQSLIALLGTPGRFVGLLFVVLQLAAAGGTYPIQTSATFFQVLHGWLPLTDAVQSFRTLIAGGSVDIGSWAWSLTAWLVGALLATALAAVLARRRATVDLPAAAAADAV